MTRNYYCIYFRYMKTLINIKTDRDVKEEAQKLAKEIGLPLSAIINASLKNFIRNKKITFSVLPRMTPALEDLVAKAEKDIRKGENISGPFSNDREFTAYLDSL